MDIFRTPLQSSENHFLESPLYVARGRQIGKQNLNILMKGIQYIRAKIFKAAHKLCGNENVKRVILLYIMRANNIYIYTYMSTRN